MQEPKRRQTHEGRNDPGKRHAQNTRVQRRCTRPCKYQREETETSSGEKCSHRTCLEILGERRFAGIHGEEATVKTFRRTGANVVLEPSNPTMEPMVFDPAEVEIYGKVVTVLRRL